MSGFHGIPSGSSLFMGTTPMTTPRPAPMIIKYEHLPEDDYASTAAAAEAATSALTQCQSVTDSHVQLTDQNIHTAENGLVEVQPPPVVDIDIVINNVVCTFTTKCHLNLKRIAMEGVHVEYRRENGMVNMKLRKPSTTASIWSSGKITCTGATSEDLAYVAARRFARTLQKMEFPVRFGGFRVVNVLGTCVMPFGIRITHFSRQHREHACYEPELHPGVTYKIKEPKATLKIFSTGSITVTAPSVQNVQLAIEHIYPLVAEFKLETNEPRADQSLHLMPTKHRAGRKVRRITHPADLEYDSDEELPSDIEEYDSDESQD